MPQAELIIPWNQTQGWRDWKVSDFMAWHKGLVKQFGKQKDSKGNLLTDKYLTIFWVASEGSVHAKAQAIIALPSQFKDELEYFRDNAPVFYSISGMKTAVDLGKINPIDITVNAVESAFGAIQDTIDAFTTTTKILKYAIPTLVVLIIIVAGVAIWKKYAS